MRDSPSYSSVMFSSSKNPSEPSPIIKDSVHDETTVAAAASVHSKKSKSIKSKKSTASKSSKQSRKSSTKDKRDDYSNRASISNASPDKREDGGALFSLPESMVASTAGSSKRSKGKSDMSQARSKTALSPDEVTTKSNSSNSTKSRKSKASRSSSNKSKQNISMSNPATSQGGLQKFSVPSEQDDILTRKSKSTVKLEAPSVTSSMAAKRRQLKAKEVEIEEKRIALQRAERLNAEREMEINAKLAVLRGKDKDDVVKLQDLKVLEIQLGEREKELTKLGKEREQEMVDKFEAVRLEESQWRKKEKDIERRVKDFARKEEEMKERLAVIDAASVARKKKERELEVQVLVFAQKEMEIKHKLAAINAASVAMRKERKRERLRSSPKMMIVPMNPSDSNKKGTLLGKLKSFWRKGYSI